LKPDAVIGTGGYGSALPLYIASKSEIPFFIQEQNSYPGITTRHFAENAKTIFTAFPGVDIYLKKKTVFWQATQFGETLLMGIA
jgi:UDP-N-acetylglucosamine--N-acetylmuramyl-(pentapeptide) pyrophosphoryl-undecaprenol N-acetylglucosamine transferase